VTSEFQSLYVNNMMVLEHYFDQDGTFGFLPDMTEAKYQFHLQKSGNYFLHAPWIMLPYLAQKQGAEGISAVDISKFVRRSFDDETLYDYCVKDDGGPTLDTLKKLLRPFNISNSPLVGTEPSSDVDKRDYVGPGETHACIRAGAGTVHSFSVHKNFNGNKHPKGKTGYLRFAGPNEARGRFVEVDDKSKDGIEVELKNFLEEGSVRSVPQPRNLEHKGLGVSMLTSDLSARKSHNSRETRGDGKEGKTTEEETHAMLLLGGRKDEKGNTWLLLQNWWLDLQLVEVSSEYFKNCKAELSFVHRETIMKDTDSASLENCYTMNKFRVAECNNLDRAEAPNRGLLYVRSRDRTV
jgi:hypothetical protein